MFLCIKHAKKTKHSFIAIKFYHDIKIEIKILSIPIVYTSTEMSLIQVFIPKRVKFTTF